MSQEGNEEQSASYVHRHSDQENLPTDLERAGDHPAVESESKEKESDPNLVRFIQDRWSTALILCAANRVL